MKLIDITAPHGNADTIRGLAEQFECLDVRVFPPTEDGLQSLRLVVSDDRVQPVLDALQGVLGAQTGALIGVVALETVLPRPPEHQRKEEDAATTTREALFDAVERDARLGGTFVVLVLLSTVVAAVGLVKDNVAVVIAAMVIAPLLGPNLALALGTALGDAGLMWKAMRTNLVGLGLALGVSIAIGALWTVDLGSHELAARTDVGLDSVAVALASGAAAVLSMTTGLASILVGVMVAVALLPPTVTAGFMLGAGETELAVSAALLLAVNVVCVNLSANVVFLAKGINPRTWREKTRARRATVIYIAVWIVTLMVLVGAIVARRELGG